MKKQIIITICIILSLITMINAQNELLTNLTHYFSFDNDNFTNKISNPAHQSINNSGTTNVSGILGDARYCDGTTTYMEQQYLQDMNGARTINYWYKSTDSRIIEGNGGEEHFGTYDTTYNFIQLNINDVSTGEIELDMAADAGTKYQYSIFTNANFLDGNWHMITFTKPDNNATNYKIYFDGVEQNLTKPYTDEVTDLSFDTTFFLCGRGGISSLHLTNMTIDEWAEWNTAINQTQIDDLYNSGSGLPYENFTGTPYNFTNCTENWICNSSSRACRVSNTRECYSVEDSNTCGNTFTGNITDYDIACTYTTYNSNNGLRDALNYYFTYNNNNLNSETGAGSQTNNGTTNVSGILGDARYCDGTTNLINDFDLTNIFKDNFSINFWYKAPITQYYTAGYSVEMMGYWTTDNHWALVDWEIDHPSYYPANSLLFGFGDGGVSSGETYITNNTMFDNEWHMITITKTGNTTDSAKIYIDGALQSQSYYGRYTEIEDVQQLNWSICARTINGSITGGMRYTNMTIDELGFWNKELTQNDINQLYFNTEGITYNNFTVNCTENWTCNSYDTCNINNITECLSVIDNNMCGNLFIGNLSTYDNSCIYTPPCTPNWTCDAYNNCNINNITECTGVADINMCGQNFTGNLTDYDTACTYTTPQFTYEERDIASVVVDTIAKAIRGIGLFAVIIGLFLGAGIAVLIVKLIKKK